MLMQCGYFAAGFAVIVSIDIVQGRNGHRRAFVPEDDHVLPNIRRDLEAFEQLEQEAQRQRITVEELARRIKFKADSIGRAMDIHREAQTVAADVNMSLEDLGAQFAKRSLSIRGLRQTYVEVNQTAHMLNVPVQVLQKKIQDKAKSIVEFVKMPPTDMGNMAEQTQAPHQQEQRDHPRIHPSGQSQQPLLFIGIYTSFSELAKLRRNEIRDTYLQHDLVQAGGPIVWKFVVGFVPDTLAGSKQEADLEREALHFPSQFLRLRIEETYEGLTAKTFALLTWFAETSPAKWILKLDDDTFPHLSRIHAGLMQEQGNFVQLGMVFDCAPVLHHTKWAENTNLWNHSFFPKYMQGSGYFLSGHLVQNLAQEHFYQNRRLMLRNEDAAIGVWIEMEKKADPSWEVHLKPVAATLSGCSPGDWISMNNQPGYMRCYWRRHKRGEDDICCYGPLNNLRQSLLQQKVYRRSMRYGCHPSAIDRPSS